MFITGVSTGIGRSLAAAAAGQGYRVFGTVRSDADGRSLAAELGTLFHPVLLDITDESSVRLAAAELIEKIGPGGLDVLVNNAGIAVPGALSEVDSSSLRSQIEVNTIAPVLLARAFLPLLDKRPGVDRSHTSLIVNISSMVVALNPPLSGGYTASKAALEAFSHAWRRELKSRGIRVMIVRPGAVTTAIWEKGEAGPPEPDPFYARAHRRKADLTARALTSAHSGAAFAERVLKLIGRRRPPLLVTLSREPFAARILLSLLPRRWADILVNTVMGLQVFC